MNNTNKTKNEQNVNNKPKAPFQPPFCERVNLGYAPPSSECFPGFANPISLQQMRENQMQLGTYMDAVQSFMMIQALEKTEGNFSESARILGLNRTTFMMQFRLLRRFGIDATAYKPSSKED